MRSKDAVYSRLSRKVLHPREDIPANYRRDKYEKGGSEQVVGWLAPSEERSLLLVLPMCDDAERTTLVLAIDCTSSSLHTLGRRVKRRKESELES